VLCCAVLCCAVLCCAVLCCAVLQADGHPGNILVQPGGRVALLDYGQSKQLGEKDKRAFADLILAMNR